MSEITSVTIIITVESDATGKQEEYTEMTLRMVEDEETFKRFMDKALHVVGFDRLEVAAKEE